MGGTPLLHNPFLLGVVLRDNLQGHMSTVELALSKGFLGR